MFPIRYRFTSAARLSLAMLLLKALRIRRRGEFRHANTASVLMIDDSLQLGLNAGAHQSTQCLLGRFLGVIFNTN